MAHEQITPAQEEARQKKQREELEKRAADRVKPWGKPQRDDYDFKTWTKDAGKNCLQAGAVYEYARESRKLRCLVTLMDPKRPREEWEKVRTGSIDGKTPTREAIDSYSEKARWLPCSFEGLNEDDAERALGGFLYCLADLADDLAENVSFGELYRNKRDKLEKAFRGLNELRRVEKEFRQFLPLFEAVEVATRSGAGLATTLETIKPFRGKFIAFTSGKASSEVIAIRVHWRGFTNSEIGKSMERFARKYRPRKKVCEEPKRKGQRPKEIILSQLKALSVLRIRKLHERKQDQWKRLELVAKVCAYKGCVKELAEYKERCSQGQGDEPMGKSAKVEISKARDDALSHFQNLFPAENPSNF